MTEETKDTRKIKYMKHPVTKKEKAKVRAQGFTIIDERFDPDYKPTAPEADKSPNPPGNAGGGGQPGT